MRHLTIAASICVLCVMAVQGGSRLSAQGSSVAGASDGAPVTIARARQFDITSRITGRSYRVMVSKDGY